MSGSIDRKEQSCCQRWLLPPIIHIYMCACSHDGAEWGLMGRGFYPRADNRRIPVVGGKGKLQRKQRRTCSRQQLVRRRRGLVAQRMGTLIRLPPQRS